jgi:hypothetical protein
MNEDSPSGSPYETLAEHDQSETKRDRSPSRCMSNWSISVLLLTSQPISSLQKVLEVRLCPHLHSRT